MTDRQKNVDYKKIAKTLSKNYWTISTLVLAVLLISVLISGGISGATVSAETAGQKVLDFAKAQYPDAELISTIEEKGMYQVVLLLDGQEAPVYVTKDGNNLVPSLIPLTIVEETTTPTQQAPITAEVIKSNKPIIEAFVMAYCPYGTQIEKGLIPVMNLLGDKIDAEIKFVYYAMHPTQGEVEEQLNQYCIQKEQNPLYLAYLTCFLEDSDGEGCLTSTGIDMAQLTTCTTATDAEFNVLANLEDQSSWLSGRFPKFDIHKAENEAYKIGGSPTLVINGAQVQAGRDASSLLNAICATFNEAPEECNTDLSSLGTPAPGFGFGTQGSATAAGCGV